MKLSDLPLLFCAAVAASGSTLNKRSQFSQGEPIDDNGKGGPILGQFPYLNTGPFSNPLLGGTNHQIDLQNPDNLAAQSTDAGTVPNLKWSFSQSKTRIFNGGWVRERDESCGGRWCDDTSGNAHGRSLDGNAPTPR